MPEHYQGLTLIKDPDAVLDYAFDWNPSDCPWLQSGETIQSHTVTADAGITVDSSAESGGAVTVVLSGGTDGESYKVSCRIVTSVNSRTDERSVTILVCER